MARIGWAALGAAGGSSSPASGTGSGRPPLRVVPLPFAARAVAMLQPTERE